MTRGGYISDTRCPTNPEHGNCYDHPNGWFCPTDEHHIQGTKFFWTDDEWEAIKSAPTSGPITIPEPNPRNRENRRRPRQGNRAPRRTRRTR